MKNKVKKKACGDAKEFIKQLMHQSSSPNLEDIRPLIKMLNIDSADRLWETLDKIRKLYSEKRGYTESLDDFDNSYTGKVAEIVNRINKFADKLDLLGETENADKLDKAITYSINLSKYTEKEINDLLDQGLITKQEAELALKKCICDNEKCESNINLKAGLSLVCHLKTLGINIEQVKISDQQVSVILKDSKNINSIIHYANTIPGFKVEKNQKSINIIEAKAVNGFIQLKLGSNTTNNSKEQVIEDYYKKILAHVKEYKQASFNNLKEEELNTIEQYYREILGHIYDWKKVKTASIGERWDQEAIRVISLFNKVEDIYKQKWKDIKASENKIMSIEQKQNKIKEVKELEKLIEQEIELIKFEAIKLLNSIPEQQSTIKQDLIVRLQKIEKTNIDSLLFRWIVNI